MPTSSRISVNWREPLAAAAYATGVSLHSHTSSSEESLQFIQQMGMSFPGVAGLQRHYERLCRERHGITLDFERANWRPPLLPRMAYEVEALQIQRLGLYPLVSLTDHDTMEAAVLLRNVASSRHIPMSVEWSVAFGNTFFHLGIHNLPSSEALDWMRRFRELTAAPDDATLLRMMRELHEMRQVLTVLNHPLWDLHKVGEQVHRGELLRFLREAGACVHAIELNGLRHAKENREAVRLAEDWGHLLISGGDRHGQEPNANINLTDAVSFTQFVEEIRVERRSHVHFMDQYAERWEQRILSSTLNAVTDFPEFLPGWQGWDERAFHPDANGEMRSFRELWVGGRPPAIVRAAIGLVRLGERRMVAAPLSLAFPGVNQWRPGADGLERI